MLERIGDRGVELLAIERRPVAAVQILDLNLVAVEYDAAMPPAYGPVVEPQVAGIIPPNHEGRLFDFVSGALSTSIRLKQPNDKQCKSQR